MTRHWPHSWHPGHSSSRSIPRPTHGCMHRCGWMLAWRWQFLCFCAGPLFLVVSRASLEDSGGRCCSRQPRLRSVAPRRRGCPAPIAVDVADDALQSHLTRIGPNEGERCGNVPMSQRDGCDGRARAALNKVHVSIEVRAPRFPTPSASASHSACAPARRGVAAVDGGPTTGKSCRCLLLGQMIMGRSLCDANLARRQHTAQR